MNARTIQILTMILSAISVVCLTLGLFILNALANDIRSNTSAIATHVQTGAHGTAEHRLEKLEKWQEKAEKR
jgi:ABC-type lipoprotein release transport system permease subunit